MRKADTLVVIAIAAPMAMCASPSSIAMAPVPLTVRFKLTDLEYQPIADAAVRVTVGSDPRWQLAW